MKSYSVLPDPLVHFFPSVLPSFSFPASLLSSFLAAIIYNVKRNIFDLFFSIYLESLCKILPFVAQSVKNLSAVQETWVRSLC